MPRNYKRKVITKRHWNAIKDYCNGENLRTIEDKYDVGSSTTPALAKQIGITPRPSGFASYKVARKWVLQAQQEYAQAISQATKQQQPATSVTQNDQHSSQ